jgi:predicted nuclease of predicted toxin-antitoxin system
VRFLIDNSVSWRVGRDLQVAGHDAVHVASIGLAESDDPIVFVRAVTESRTLLTQDADFGSIHSVAPLRIGVLLLRLASGHPGTQAAVILQNLDSLSGPLEGNGYVILSDSGILIADAGDRGKD